MGLAACSTTTPSADASGSASPPTWSPALEPFPRGIVYHAAFDAGTKAEHWPGDFELVEAPPPGANWRAARSVPRKDGAGTFVSLPIQPPRPVGLHTKLRFRYHLTGARALTVQVFDATVQDNRHVRLESLREGAWTTVQVDLTRDSRRNDGTSPSPFPAGYLVDDIFFFVGGPGAASAVLHLDEVVLFDAAPSAR